MGEAGPGTAGGRAAAPRRPWPTPPTTPLTGATTDGHGRRRTPTGAGRPTRRCSTPWRRSPPREDRAAVAAAVGHVYTPWLRDVAELFQERVKREPAAGSGDRPARGRAPRHLRLVRRRAAVRPGPASSLAALAGRVGRSQSRHHIAALPTVTPTAKPAVSPVAAQDRRADGGRGVPPLRRPGRQGPDRRTGSASCWTRTASRSSAASETGEPDGQGVDRVRQPGPDRPRRGDRTWPAGSRSCSPGWSQRIEALLDGGLAGGPGRHRPRLAAGPRRAAQGGPAEVPDGDPLGAVRRGEADRDGRLP